MSLIAQYLTAAPTWSVFWPDQAVFLVVSKSFQDSVFRTLTTMLVAGHGVFKKTISGHLICCLCWRVHVVVKKRNADSATLRDRQNLHEFLEQQAQLAVLGENAAQRKLTEAESDMEIKKWERRNSECALYESQCEIESQRHQWRQASQWADQAQREIMRLCGELDRKNRLHQESYTRNRQEIEELRRRCYKEENKLSQYRLDEFSMLQERDPNTVSHLKDQIRELQEQVNFMLLTLGTALGYPTFLISLLSLRVPGESRAAILDCCVIHEMKWVFEETILKTYLLEKNIPQNSSKIQ